MSNIKENSTLPSIQYILNHSARGINNASWVVVVGMSVNISFDHISRAAKKSCKTSYFILDTLTNLCINNNALKIYVNAILGQLCNFVHYVPTYLVSSSSSQFFIPKHNCQVTQMLKNIIYISHFNYFTSLT